MRWTLPTKIILSMSGLLLTLSIAVSLLTFVAIRRGALEEQEDRADVLNYTFETLLSQDALPSLQRVTENSATAEEVRRITIVTQDKRVLASSERRQIGKRIVSASLDQFLARGGFQRITVERGDELTIVQPLRGSHSMGGPSGDIVGAVQITLALGVIEARARAAAYRLLAISVGSYLVLFLVLVAVLRSLVTGPVRALATAAQHFRQGDRSLRTTIRRTDEIGVLSAAFDDMADEVETILAGLEQQVASRTSDLETQRAELAQALEDLQKSTAARLELAETVRQLSTPVIKLYEGVLVMPIVGAVDAERAEQIQRSLLAGIDAHGAEEVLFDLTGVVAVNTEVAASLLRAAAAAQLLGASVTIVGITGRVAQSIIELGVDLSGVATYSDLQTGLLQALRKRRRVAARAGALR